MTPYRNAKERANTAPEPGEWQCFTSQGAGRIADVEPLYPGCWFVTTTFGFHGVKLSTYRNSQVHRSWRQYGGWYNADNSEWAIPIITLSKLGFISEYGWDKLIINAATTVICDELFFEYVVAYSDPNNHECDEAHYPGDAVLWFPKLSEMILKDENRTYSHFVKTGKKSWKESYISIEKDEQKSLGASMTVAHVIDKEIITVASEKKMLYQLLIPSGEQVWVEHAYVHSIDCLP